MAKILIKRGKKASLPVLDNAELGLCTDTEEVFIGNNSSNLQFLLLKDIVNNLTSGGATKVLSAEQGRVLKGLIDSLTSKVDGKADSSTMTSQLNTKINTSAIKNDLTTGGSANVLSAEQGRTLKGLVDGKISTSLIKNDLTGGASNVLSAEQGKILKGLVDGKISTSLIKNDLTTGGAGNVLSAEQGKALKILIDSLTSKVNGKADTTVASTSVNGLMTAADKKKLDGIATGANNYSHPSSHPASIITQDSTHRFVTDAEKNKWNAAGGGSSATVTPISVASDVDLNYAYTNTITEQGDLVVITMGINSQPWLEGISDGTVLFTLPTTARPKSRILATVTCLPASKGGGSTPFIASVYLDNSGQVSLNGNQTPAASVYGSIVFSKK